ncbi:hypothetical protein GSI_08618 [Ganoderma sinense ZZ0214-1]|uniref:Uncharacterized protein n=1 Tax=Ganoderma sinense ZZ0214-1 TaxID=1077348 RepID=A0A2G8S4C4_9APHY|nr:hypothetical protein GSI_08618 [Ganoderma sinense ZZ0214-1]
MLRTDLPVSTLQPLTKKDLEEIVTGLRADVSDLTTRYTQATEELNTSQEALAEAHTALTAAQEATAAAEAARADLQQQLDNAAAAPQGALEEQVNVPLIPRPSGSGWSIQESMQVTKPEYAEIQRTIRSLVVRAVLDWTDDFRRQDADKMAKMFRAARAAHPILARYSNNWATAAIACQYMQNKRKHAYKQGYISKRRAHRAGDRQNSPPTRRRGEAA